MIMLAKIGLGIVGTLAVAGAYTFRDGVMRVDVDEHHAGGDHVHLWFPAAAVPMVMSAVPDRELAKATREAREYMPVARAVAHELGQLPDTTLVEVQDRNEHVRVSTHYGAIHIDVTDPDEDVHVVCPLATIEDITKQIAEARPDESDNR
jgi:hypothetical protein